ncbi:hypothetical protein [Paenibacillus sp. QZ-Y1]|uniref:hypothetical protein n=1 Tax=Paenibacillus sp. QZ-Y1 TaxID=3414511 RepID=UPI003F795AC1
MVTTKEKQHVISMNATLRNAPMSSINKSMQLFINEATSEINLVSRQFSQSRFFIITDDQGYVAETFGEGTLLGGAVIKVLLHKTMSLSMESFGINAVSLSIKTSNNILLEYDERVKG